MQMIRAVQVLAVASLAAFAGCRKKEANLLPGDSTATNGTPAAAAAASTAASSAHDSTATDTTPAAMAKKTTPQKKP